MLLLGYPVEFQRLRCDATGEPAPGVAWRLIPWVVKGELVTLQEVDDFIALLVPVDHCRVLGKRTCCDDLADINGEVGKPGGRTGLFIKLTHGELPAAFLLTGMFT